MNTNTYKSKSEVVARLQMRYRARGRTDRIGRYWMFRVAERYLRVMGIFNGATLRRMFADFPTAFDYCREVNRPVTVIVIDQNCKLFPSGRAERIKDKPGGSPAPVTPVRPD